MADILNQRRDGAHPTVVEGKEVNQISEEVFNERLKVVIDIARKNSLRLFEMIRNRDDNEEPYGTVSMEEIVLADKKSWGTERTIGAEKYGSQIVEDNDFVAKDQQRTSVKKGLIPFHIHPKSSSSEPSGQDLFAAAISLAEIIYHESISGDKEATVLISKVEQPIGNIEYQRNQLWYEAGSIAEQTGTFQHSEFNYLASGQLNLYIETIKL